MGLNNNRARWKWLLAVAAVAALVAFFCIGKAGHELRPGDVSRLANFLHSFGVFAVVAGMLAIFLQTWFPLVPFILIAGANAYVFGLAGGFAVNYGMSCAAALSMFVIARYVARERVEARLAKMPSARTFNEKLEQHGFLYTLIGRLIPVIPSLVINLGAGVSKIRLRSFLAATLIGKLPIVFLETLIGHDLLHFREHKGRLAIVLALFVLLLWIGHRLKARWTAGKRQPLDLAMGDD